MMSEQFDQLFNVEITVTPPSELDQKIAALCREATTYKNVDWDKAVACLQEAKGLMKKSKVVRSIDYYWIRLPIFLQQAGRFDEAIKEFEWLLKDVETRLKKAIDVVEHPLFFESCVHSDYAVIYDKMRMACKREKRVDDVKNYQALSEQHRLLHEDLKEVIAIEEKAKRGWQANTVRYTCSCGGEAGYQVGYKYKAICNRCGKTMKKAHCTHESVIPRLGTDSNDPKKGKCAKCGVYMNWVDELNKSLYAN